MFAKTLAKINICWLFLEFSTKKAKLVSNMWKKGLFGSFSRKFLQKISSRKRNFDNISKISRNFLYSLNGIKSFLCQPHLQWRESIGNREPSLFSLPTSYNPLPHPHTQTHFGQKTDRNETNERNARAETVTGVAVVISQNSKPHRHAWPTTKYKVFTARRMKSWKEARVGNNNVAFEGSSRKVVLTVYNIHSIPSPYL